MDIVQRVRNFMTEIPGGVIELRDDRKKRVWETEIKRFTISKYQVTQELYYSVTGENPSFFKSNDKPVESVSWIEAIAFCNLLSKLEGLNEYYIVGENGDVTIQTGEKGYRLPSDAEWEYACKAKSTKPRYGELDEIAWYHENSSGSTQNVGLKKPNDWGLYDMLGNVWEWCEDVYDAEVYGSYRVFRGGGWSDNERGILATNRRRSHPTYKIEDVGFRLARSE